MTTIRTAWGRLCLLAAATAAVSCTPRIELAMPSQPITINMNVKIEHDITVKADRQSVALLRPVLCPGVQNCPATNQKSASGDAQGSPTDQ
ncbi:YnbE family lipoprotein [Martelella alba]|uniref:YnbE family lipoprotein n=1 Tax=Martelella alba TaxID=2590451 RepID=A0ABY2SPP8_9HYPH|nr:YnbE family lipoprotein [Martelella alba]TKI08077.1 YnbE family lipoprotein [Martelella alba]